MKMLRMVLYVAAIAIVFAGVRLQAATPALPQGGGVQTGVFYLVEGLNYSTPTLHGLTNAKGEFQYHPGETVTFSVGDFVLGAAPGANRLNSSDLVLGTNGDIKKLKFLKTTNMARFLQSLDEDGNIENGITITPETVKAVDEYDRKIEFTKSETAFGEDPEVIALFGKLHKTLRTGPEARNYMRWTILGVQLQSDVKVPMRDGSYLMAYVYRPIDEEKHPTIVTLGDYGMANFRGCSCNPQQLAQHEATEDQFMEGNPNNAVSENFEIADVWYWVPKGYDVIRIDARGICKSPGVDMYYGVQEQEDYYDAIEYFAKQPWSNGKVGLLGASMYGINQFAVASLQPPHLAAMIDIVGDVSHYREIVYAGGILNTAQYRGSVPKENGWYFDSVKINRCYNQKTFEDVLMDKEEYWLAHPFNEAPWYGTHDVATIQNGVRLPLEVDADMSKVTVPFQAHDSIEHANHQHIKGEIEAYMAAATPPKDKQLFVVTGDDIGGWIFTTPFLDDSVRFFDYWLKGVKNGVMDEPKVRMMIRTGDGGWYWQTATEYPVPQTDYKKYYMDATQSNWAGDGKRNDFLKLTSTPPAAKTSKSYSADISESRACWQPGISFVTEPMPEDETLAGFIKLHLWVSSTSSDADIFASMRVMDKDNKEIPYALLPRGGYYPVGEGQQKVSHRALDKNKSTEWRPWTTDTKADYAPLKSPSEIVPVDVELEPMTALIHKGDRIRLDVQPVEGCDYGAKDAYPYAFTSGTQVLADAEPYQKGATNTIYTGGDHTSYLQVPVIPTISSK